MPCEQQTDSQLIVVPPERLSPETLSALIEEFVTRSGTDYGRREAILSEKCAAVRTQLTSGRVQITYDPVTQTCTIVPAEEVRRFSTACQKKGSQ
jgi:uncharacterized protein